MPSDAPALLRGQLHWVSWQPARGSEQAGRRPALVIQTDSFNRSERYTNTIVAAVTTTDRPVPVHIAIDPDAQNGLDIRSFVMCEQLMTISRERLDGYIGAVDESTMASVDAALKRILQLP